MLHTNKKKVIRLLKIVEGQVRGLQEMINAEKYCVDIITQTSAAKQALSGIENTLLENHLNTCVLHQIKANQTSKAIGEIMKIYKLKRK
ncbi:metal-sensitive transcriptional regulator [Candidatus Peregrinibacteria bacterium]|nr:metal-sensitive transcriptional regulator [Candidatus Peregrinibacteria bacterium]